MAFTDETTVREHTGLKNTARVPSSLVIQRINDAHAAILADLQSAYASSTDVVLKLAETELASAYLLRSLSTQAAFDEINQSTAGLAHRESRKSERLRELADEQERSAWSRLRPWLRTPGEAFGFGLSEPGEPADNNRLS